MKKINYLDGLRGLAAFMVVFHHFILAFYPALFSGADATTHLKPGVEAFASGSVFNLFYNGNFAVCIFFVISGFVMSHKFFQFKDHEIITASAIKRYLRLAIPVSISVFLAYLFMKFSLFYNNQAADISGSGWLGGFWNFTPNFMDMLNQAFVGTFFSSVFEYNKTLWTIAFEFTGSFLVLGFVALFGKMRNRHWAYLVAIIIFLQSYYLAFILGMILSDLMAHKNMIIQAFDRSKILRTGLLLLGLFIGSYPSGLDVTGTIYAPLNNSFMADPAVMYHVLGAFLVIMVLLDSKRMQKFFSGKYLLFLGEISFAMYLLHFIILGSFSSFIFLKLSPHVSYFANFAISFMLSVAIIIPTAYLMSRHIDRRVVKLSHKAYDYLFKNNN